jgi:hypothetical protein
MLGFLSVELEFSAALRTRGFLKAIAIERRCPQGAHALHCSRQLWTALRRPYPLVDQQFDEIGNRKAAREGFAGYIV